MIGRVYSSGCEHSFVYIVVALLPHDYARCLRIDGDLNKLWEFPVDYLEKDKRRLL